ncbi:MAG: translation initiation factor IF-2, partial [Bacteroidota bacterium]|nr:translation initiation factor IF-2 [Bacteroidota bacterium]
MKTIRINKVLRELNISLDRAVEFLNEKGHVIESRPTAKISQKEYDFLLEEFQTDRTKREASNEVYEVKKKEKEAQIQEAIEKAQKHEKSITIKTSTGLKGLKKVGKINLEDSQILKTG